MKSSDLIKELDKLFPDAKCELNYNNDYELLIATLLSAQSTDKRVNSVTEILFSKYDIYTLALANPKDIEEIIRPVGTQERKAKFIVEVAKSLVENYDGHVPNDRKYVESLPGVGHKTCNVVLSNIYNVPSLAVDTHVTRVTNRLGLVNTLDVKKIEEELMNYFPEESWIRVHHQLVLFGRYICKSAKPDCNNCPFKCKKKLSK